MDMQKSMIAQGFESTAVGAYQMIADTLKNAVKMSGIDPTTTKFSKATQDYLARNLIGMRAERAMKNGTIDPKDFANELSNEWAAFKNSTGKGSYDKVGSNKATVSFNTVHDIASNLLNTNAVPGPATGLSFAQTDKTITRPSREIPSEPSVPSAETDVPVPSPRPTTRTEGIEFPNQAPRPTPRDQPAYDRPLMGDIAAAGIDVLTGPLGAIASLGTLAFTGSTVGGLTVDAMLGKYGENYYQQGSHHRRSDSSGGTRGEERTQENYLDRRDTTVKTEEEPTTFEDKYLYYTDTTWRPTPVQKWGEVPTHPEYTYNATPT
jgi:hypothetical protein